MLHAAHGSSTVLRHGELVNAASQRSVDRSRQNYRTACRCSTTLLGGGERFLAAGETFRLGTPAVATHRRANLGISVSPPIAPTCT
jgi:hypothetical protein